MDEPFVVYARDRRTIRRLARHGCEVVRERDFRRVGHRILDLSAGGMRVVADTPVLTGETMLVSFRAPGSDLFVDAEATVTRVIHGRRPEDRGLALGLKFRAMEEESRRVLSLSLLRLPAPWAERAPRVDWAKTVKSIAYPALRSRSSTLG